jgi:hypothetical protein
MSAMAQQRFAVSCEPERHFVFSGRPRKLPCVSAIPFRWPTKAAIAKEYISSWTEMAGEELARHRLSNDTMKCIASHTSRRDGTCRLTDGALSSRTDRSISSTKRDIQRLKKLGLIVADYESGDRRQERVRILKIAVPERPRSSQRILSPEAAEVVSTHPLYVDPLD